jgi:hypothetical protein
MQTPHPPTARPSVDWRRAEFLLVLLGLLGFITFPIQISTVPGGLPAHPLLLHVPVILIPVTAAAGLAFAVKPDLLERYGIALAVVSVSAMSGLFLARNAGFALQDSLGLTSGPLGQLVDQHSESADTLTVVYVAFTAFVILAFAARRISAGRPTGLGIVDRLFSAPAVLITMRVIVALLAIGAVVAVIRTGDQGAKAVWIGSAQVTTGAPTLERV